MLVNNQPNKAVACRADISLCCSVAILDDDIDRGLTQAKNDCKPRKKDNGRKIEKGEQREKYACAQSLFVWRTRTLDRRRIWLVMMVAFWLLAANQNHVFFRSFRAENLRLICSLLEIFDGSRDAKIMKNFKTQKHKGRLNVKRNGALLIFKSFPWPVAPPLP